MILYGQRIYIEKLKLAHVQQMKYWGKHDNPLIADYNYALNSSWIQFVFYLEKLTTPFKKYYAVCLNSGRMIGYFSIRNINRIEKSSVLGISFDANYSGAGYGYETLELYLEEYFVNMNFEVMYLEVATFNKRAKAMYEKIGFEFEAEYLVSYPNKKLNFDEKNYLENKNSFVVNNGVVYNYIHKMSIRRERYEEWRRADEI